MADVDLLKLDENWRQAKMGPTDTVPVNNLGSGSDGSGNNILHDDGTWQPEVVATGVQSVTGLDTDNTDPQNPVVQIAVDGVTVTGDGTPGDPLVATPSAGTTNLGYIPSPTDGTVTSDTGTDATIPLVDDTPSPGTAGLLGPADYASFKTRTQWMGEWTQQQYLPYQQVVDEGYLAIANTTTEERPAPQKIGEPFNIYNGTIGTTTANARQVLFGNKYTFTENVFFEGWRINIIAGNRYVIYVVRDPDGDNIISQVLQFVAQNSGWINLTAQSFIIEAGSTYAAIAVVSEPAVVPVTFSGNWSYAQPQNPTAPISGQITQPKSVPSLLYVNNFDSAVVDRSAQLATLNVGDTIQTSTNLWAIQSISPQVGYYIFGISPALLNVNLGVQNFTFETKSTATLTYPLDANYWGLNPVPVATVQGLLGIDIPYSSIVPNTTAYGIDLLVQNLVLSSDWDIQAFSGIGGGGGGGSSTIIDINGVAQDLSADRVWRTAQADTGVLTFAGLTPNSGTTINIGAATGWIVDNETNPAIPVSTYVTYPGALNVAVPVGAGIGSYVMLDTLGVISFQTTFPTSAQRKAKIWLGKVAHPLGVITAVINEPDFITSPQAFARDLFQALGPYINDNVYPYPNGANLSINITGGNIHGNGINFVGGVANRQTPDEIPTGPSLIQPFIYRTQTGAGGGPVVAIDPTNYDVGGVITPVGGGINRSTLQYIFNVPGAGFIVQYGQNFYASLIDAVAAVGRETFVVWGNIPNNAILLGVVAMIRTATALNNTAQARFFNADKLGQIIGATAGTTTGTLQTAYNNSVVPQVVTTDVLGAVTLRSGMALNTTNIQAWQNIAGTTTASITGEGRFSPLDVILADQTVPAIPFAGTFVFRSFSQQGFSVPRIYDTQGNAIEVTRDNLIVVRNTSGGAIARGEAVYVSGGSGSVATVAKAKADSEATMTTVGLMYDNVINNGFGRVIFLGAIESINTSAFTDGDIIYVSATTAGAITATAPSSPNIIQPVGRILNAGVGNGVVFVAPKDRITPTSSGSFDYPQVLFTQVFS